MNNEWHKYDMHLYRDSFQNYKVYQIPKAQLIIAALKEGARITPMGALRRFGCFRLSARIMDIRKMGYKVKTRIVSRNRKNYAEYYLEA